MPIRASGRLRSAGRRGGARLAGKLAPKRRVASVGFPRGQPLGPPDEPRIPADQVKADRSEAGYAITAEHALPSEPALPRLRRTANVRRVTFVVDRAGLW